MSIRKSKVFAVAAAACVLGMMLGGCGSSTSGNATEGSNVITAFDSEPQNGLIPGNTNETGGGRPIDLLFAGLVSFDKDGKAQNEVAESITANDDATQYDIKLKDGWKFTDGTDVTAESFTKAWSYTANAKNAQLCSSFFSTIKGYDALQDTDNLKGDEQLEGLKIVNDHEFTVDLNKSDSVFAIKVGYSAFAPLPESFYDDTDAFGEAPVGNGPYKFQSWDHDNEIVLVKNPDYKGNRTPKNDGVTFKVYTKDDAAYADIQSGALDVMESVPASATKTFETDETVQAYNKAGSVIQQFTIPSSLKHFEAGTEEGTLRRQAISMAINRENICDKVLNGTGTPAVDFTSPLTPGYSDSLKGVGNLKYNEKKAKELWEKANAISPWTSDDKLTFAYNADGGHETTYTAVVNSSTTRLVPKWLPPTRTRLSTITVPPCPIARFRAHSVAAGSRIIRPPKTTWWPITLPPPLMAMVPTMAITRIRSSMTCAPRLLPHRPPMRPISCTSRLRKCCSTISRPFRCTTPTPTVWLLPAFPVSK